MGYAISLSFFVDVLSYKRIWYILYTNFIWQYYIIDFYSSSSGIYFCMIFLVIMVIRQLNILETDINTLKETFELTLGDFYNVQLLMYIYYW